METLSPSQQSAEYRTDDGLRKADNSSAAGRIILGALALLAVTAVVQSWSEIVRYIKMRNM